MIAPKLTPKAQRVLDFIRSEQARTGLAPTHMEINAHMGWKSAGTSHKYMVRLERMGLIRRQANCTRGIALPTEHVLPLTGARITVPAEMLANRPGSADHYVVRMIGDSMSSEGINDGDFAVVLRRDPVEPGEAVIALVGEQATVKRWYPEPDGRVRLQPLNPKAPAVTYPAVDVTFQGVVVGIMRKF